LDVLRDGRHVIPIVPVNIPILPEVDVAHLIYTTGKHFSLKDRVFEMVLYLTQREEIKEVSTIYAIVSSIFEVSAWLPSSLQTRIFQIIHNKCRIMNNFSEATNKEHISILFITLKHIPSES